MPTYSVSNQDMSNADLWQEVSLDSFGANLLITQSLTDSGALVGSNLSKGISNLNINSLRYPGGGVTEEYFSMSHPDSNYDQNSNKSLIPQGEFFRYCAEANISANLVIKTVNGFTTSAAEALISGEYGKREISEAYLAEVKKYVTDSLVDAFDQSSHVRIKSFEIGNEFWGSGQMTATEYGRLAAKVLVAAQQGIAAALQVRPELKGMEKPSLLVQSVHADGSFSPSNDQYVYVADGTIYKTLDKVPVFVNAVPILIHGQGNAGVQLSAITDSLNNSQTRALIDGVVDHYYANQGLELADTASNYTFYQMSQFEAQIGLKPGQLERYVSEWNTKLSNVLDNRGLEGAAMLTEIFYEMSTHGISNSNIWPLVYDSVWNNVLQGQDANLTIAGSTFKLMSESLVATKPLFDYNGVVDGVELDIHGFANDNNLVMLSSNRSSQPVDNVLVNLLHTNTTIDNGQLNSRYFIVNTLLSDRSELNIVDSSLENSSSSAFLTYSNGSTTTGSVLNLDHFGGLGLMRTEITFITDQSDTVIGRDGNDEIYAGGGDDLIQGNLGRDILYGEAGHDKIYGGDGIDRIYGGDGNDYIGGGQGDDILRGGGGSDAIFGGDGNDWIDGGLGDDTISGGPGDDRLWGSGGKNAFVLNLDESGADFIVDFNRASDQIIINSGDTSGAIHGVLTANDFETSNSRDYLSGDATILYLKDVGDVYFDTDGAGGSSPTLLLHLMPGTDLGVENFFFI